MIDSKIKVGFFGGANLIEVGDTETFLMFFHAIKKFTTWDDAFQKNLICERLYRKYIKADDLESTTRILNRIRSDFNNIISRDCSLLSVFQKHFEGYEKACKHTNDFYQEFGKHIPIRIVVSTLPYCAIDTERSLEKLDTWDGPPFWTRFYLKELYDQGKDMPELPF